MRGACCVAVSRQQQHYASGAGWMAQSQARSPTRRASAGTTRFAVESEQQSLDDRISRTRPNQLSTLKRRLAAAQPQHSRSTAAAQHSTAQHSTAQRRRSEYSADLLLRYRLAHMLALFKPQRLQGLALECVAHQPERISTTYNTTDDTADNIAYNRRHSRQRLALQCDR